MPTRDDQSPGFDAPGFVILSDLSRAITGSHHHQTILRTILIEAKLPFKHVGTSILVRTEVAKELAAKFNRDHRKYIREGTRKPTPA